LGSRTRCAQLAVGLPVVALLALTGGPSTAATLPAVYAFTRTEIAGGGLFVRQSGGGGTRTRLLARRASAPAWSPDGRRLAYVARAAGGQQDLYVEDADGRNRARLTRTPGSEASGVWSPDGRRLVVERAGRLHVIGADGRGERLLTTGSEPDWSPRSKRIAFVARRDGSDDLFAVEENGRGFCRLTTSPAVESEPAWSPDGRRIAFVALDAGSSDLYVLDVRTLSILRLTQDLFAERSPTWSRDGAAIMFVSDRADGGPLWSVPAAGGEVVSLGGPPTVERLRWRPSVSPELRPDLDQRLPSDLTIQSSRGRYLLGFTSASDNVGLGPLAIVASRASVAVPTMRAAQRVRVAGGGVRTYPEIGSLRFTIAYPHEHWHLLDFQRYELRRASDHAMVVRDRKSGFCLADHWAQVRGFVPGKPPGPVFRSNCGQHEPRALAISEGTSVGYTDRYPAFFHGQNLDVTHVPAGIYVLVHRANGSLRLRELRYDNNVASLRIRLTRSRGQPSIHVLARCPDSESCP
jgi:Lysyl oxidase/WD40-like Beta Propeller Repeat